MSLPIEPSGTNGAPRTDDEPVARALEHWRQLPEHQRQSWLEDLQRSEPALASEVRSLVEYLHRDDFLSYRASNFVLACEVESDHDLAPGYRVDGYCLQRQLGEGGHGLVWSATDSNGNTVAIKFLKSGLLSENARRRFLAEQRVLKELDHPSIAKMLGAGVTEAGVPYLLLEFIDGLDVIAFSDLHELDVFARVRLMVKALRGLEAAHARKVVHRDVKPSNILVTGDPASPRVRLIDFGVAKFGGGRGTASASLTVTGQALGTTNYMSPEQIADGAKDIDAASDVYSAAVVLYELLTGHLPYDRGLLERSPADAIRHSLPLSCQRRGKSVSSAVESVLARALRKEPALRFTSAEAFAQALEACLAGRTPESVWGRRGYATRHFAWRYWLPLSATAVLLAGMGVATVVSVRSAWIAERERDAAEFSSYRTTLASVTKAIDSRDFEGARVLLAEAPVSQRGPEWDWIATMAGGAREIWKDDTGIRTLVGDEHGWWVGLMSGELVHLDDAEAVSWRVPGALSPLCAVATRGTETTHGGSVLSGYADGSLIARSMATPTQLSWQISLGTSAVGVVAASQGWIAASKKNLYRVDDDGAVRHREPFQTEITALAAGLDGDIVYLGTVDGRVQSMRWEADRWTTMWLRDAVQSSVAAIAYSAGARPETASVWVSWMKGDLAELSAANGRAIGVGLIPKGKVVSLAVDPSSGTLALGKKDGSREVIAGTEASATDIARDHSSMARVAFRRGVLATAGWDGSVRIRAMQAKDAFALSDPPGELVALAWNQMHDGVAAWRSSQDAMKLVIRKENGFPKTVSFDSDITDIAAGQQGWLVGTRGGAVYEIDADWNARLLLDPDGVSSVWVAEGSGGEVWKVSELGHCFIVTDGSATLLVDLKSGPVFGVTAPPDRDGSLAAFGSDGIIRVVSRQGVHEVVTFGEHLARVSFGSRGSVAALSAGGTRLLWVDALHSSPLSLNLENAATAGPVWLGARNRFAVGHANGHVRIVDCERMNEVALIRVSDAGVRSLVITPDGRLITLDENGVIRSIRGR